MTADGLIARLKVPQTRPKSHHNHTANCWRHSCAIQSSSIVLAHTDHVYATLTLLLAWLLLFITSAGGRRNVRWKKHTKIYSSVFPPSIRFSHSLPSSFSPTLKINISVSVFSFFLLLLLEIITRCWYLFGSPQHCCCSVRWVVTATSHHQVKGTCSASSMRILGLRACVGSSLGWTAENTQHSEEEKYFNKPALLENWINENNKCFSDASPKSVFGINLR